MLKRREKDFYYKSCLFKSAGTEKYVAKYLPRLLWNMMTMIFFCLNEYEKKNIVWVIFLAMVLHRCHALVELYLFFSQSLSIYLSRSFVQHFRRLFVCLFVYVRFRSLFPSSLPLDLYFVQLDAFTRNWQM